MTTPHDTRAGAPYSLNRFDRRAALKALGGGTLALLMPFYSIDVEDDMPLAVAFTLPLTGVISMTSNHLQGVVENSGQPSGSRHIGVDLNLAEGDDDLGNPVLAIGSGRCIHSSYSEACGLGAVVILEHNMPDGSRLYSRYAHLEEIFIVKNDIVIGGDPIGLLGRSGCQLSAHLHLDVAQQLAWDESIHLEPRWYPQQAPVWWLERRFLDPIKLIFKPRIAATETAAGLAGQFHPNG